MKLHNTLSRSIEEFTQLEGQAVGLYTCGPTVYNFAHIGNLRSFLFEDVLKRALLSSGYEVRHVMNITDVGHLVSDADTGEDKMEKGAAREGKTAWEIAEFYTQAFYSDFGQLNCLPPDVWCKATDHIPEQIDLVRRLEEKGVTYRIDDGVYFDASKFPRYADLARLDLEQIKAGARVEMAEGKKNPADFALWKFSPKGEKRHMEWESPWGTGFPGWHIECSAMAMKYLGETLDIHCGGIDHINIHHTNEIAQSEVATGKPLSRFWLHGEFLVLEKGKMAKSEGGFLTLKALKEKGFDPLDFRYFCFGAHYRMPLTFSWEGMQSARNTLTGLRNLVRDFRESDTPVESEAAREAAEGFLEEARNDLNIPNALAVLWNTIRGKDLSSGEKLAFLGAADKVLGLDLLKEEAENLEDEIEALVAERQEARKGKDFARADEIRDQLQKQGIILEDTPKGVRWKRT